MAVVLLLLLEAEEDLLQVLVVVVAYFQKRKDRKLPKPPNLQPKLRHFPAAHHSRWGYHNYFEAAAVVVAGRHILGLHLLLLHHFETAESYCPTILLAEWEEDHQAAAPLVAAAAVGCTDSTT